MRTGMKKRSDAPFLSPRAAPSCAAFPGYADMPLKYETPTRSRRRIPFTNNPRYGLTNQSTAKRIRCADHSMFLLELQGRRAGKGTPLNTQSRDLPRDWHIPFADAAAIYGDVFLAAVLEAPPSDPLFDAVARMMRKGRRDLTEAFGLVPDIRETLALTDLDCDALVQVLDVPPSLAQEYASGSTPLPCAAAVMLCRAFFWPLAAFFRGKDGYHPTTALHRELGW